MVGAESDARIDERGDEGFERVEAGERTVPGEVVRSMMSTA
jgi:hypothetical protein